MNHVYKKVVAVGLLAYAGAGLAATPTLGEIFRASGVMVNGYIDTSYTYLSGSGMFTSGATNRVFDTERNSFNLHAVDLTVHNLSDNGFGGFVQLSAGSDANVFAAADSDGGAPGPESDEFDVQEANLQYAADGLSVMVGKFVTLSGAEVIESPANLNFSRSILFGYAIPFTHTGVRASFEPMKGTKFTVGINNGWDVLNESASGDGATGKTLEFNVATSLGKSLGLVASLYTGDEPGATNGRRDLLDVVLSFTASDNLILTLNVDIAQQDDALLTGDAEWTGVAAYVDYRLNEQWRVAGRAEWFDDEDGFRTGVVQKWKEVTATVAHMPAKNVELRGEVRYDTSDEDVFAQTGGDSPEDSQYGFGLEAIYKF